MVIKMSKIIKPEAMILMPEKPRILAIFDMLKDVFDAAPENLPGFYVHPNDKWTGDAWVDSKGHLHMCEADFFKLKNMGMPTNHMKTIRDVSMHKIDVAKKMIRTLNPDQQTAKNSALLDTLGPQTVKN